MKHARSPLAAFALSTVCAASHVCAQAPAAPAEQPAEKPALPSSDLRLSADEPSATGVPPASSDLRVQISTWLWLTSMNGEVGALDRTAQVDASFGDMLEDSDSIFAFCGRLEVGYGPISGFIDGFYADLGVDDVTGAAGFANLDLTFKQGLIDFGLMYRVLDIDPSNEAAKNPQNLTLDLYAGGRYNSVDLQLAPALLAARQRSEEWVDPIIGARLVVPMAEHWHFQIGGDIGGFGVSSDLTWSATAVFSYDFHISNYPSSVFFGYRAVGWDFSDGSGVDRFIWDVTQHGPILGFAIQF